MIEVITRPLDIMRARILRHSMKIEALRKLFTERILRNNVTVALSLILNALLMLFCPLWMLMIAPSILSMLHLIESINAFHDVAAPPPRKKDEHCKKNIHRALVIFCLCFFVLRTDFGAPITFFLLVLVASFFVAAFVNKFSVVNDIFLPSFFFIFTQNFSPFYSPHCVRKT